MLWLQERALPLHETPQKNWDHYLLARIVESQTATTLRTLDLGCGELCTMEFLKGLGVPQPAGVDFSISRKARTKALTRMWRARTLTSDFKLFTGDILERDCGGGYDLLTCISVIEHGVDFAKFFQACKRQLKGGGQVLVTTDYWHDSTYLKENAAYGLPWKIFNQRDLEKLIAVAEAQGFRLAEPGPIPACKNRTVSYEHQLYTFAALVFSSPEKG